MSNYPDLAAVASLIADPARASMLSALLGDIALPAGELARLARITPQTASTHLAKLVKGNLLSVTALGRHRYFRLRDQNVAQALESLALLAGPARVTSLNDSLERKAYLL
jgi:DNA-binding transcriptional ArsR family regulator